MPRSQPKNERIQEALRLRQLREHLSLSQRDLALEFRVAHTAISSWESGTRTIPGPVLKLIEIYETEAGLPREPKPSSLSRNLRLSIAIAGLTARFAGQFLLKWIGRRPSGEQGTRKLVTTLGELKGLSMKAGQMMAYLQIGQSHALRTSFESLLDHSPPVPSETIDPLIDSELGRPRGAIFKDWNPTPIATGSIGQVFEGILQDGSRVAVKVQYPGILGTLRSDLAYTRFIDLVGPLIFREQDRKSFVAELVLKAEQECDYQREATQQERIRHAFAGDPEVVIPKVRTELSTEKLLVQDWARGVSFQELLKTGNQEARNQAGATLFRVAMTALFRHRLINCDPHPGNYSFLSHQVIFYDFGCTQDLSLEFVQRFKDLLMALKARDSLRVKKLVIEMGYAPHPGRFNFDHQDQLLRNLYAPMITDGRFRFTRAYVESLWNQIMLKNENRSSSSVPAEWLFVNRLIWGLYSVLGELEAEIPASEILRPLGLTL